MSKYDDQLNDNLIDIDFSIDISEKVTKMYNANLMKRLSIFDIR